MLKTHLKRMILTSLITLLPLLTGLILWSRLPDTVAVHFGPDGQADGWSSKAFAVFYMPLFLLGVHLLCIFLTAADPKRRSISDKALGLVFWITPLCSVIVGIVTYTIALGMDIDVNLIMMLTVGLLFIVLGNYLPKCRQNYTVGIKIPWTLHDPENWNKTHRFAGKLWIVGGAVIMLNAFLSSVWIMIAMMAVMAFLPILYSFVLYRRSLKGSK